MPDATGLSGFQKPDRVGEPPARGRSPCAARIVEISKTKASLVHKDCTAEWFNEAVTEAQSSDDDIAEENLGTHGEDAVAQRVQEPEKTEVCVRRLQPSN